MFGKRQLLLVRLSQVGNMLVIIASFLLAWYAKFVSGLLPHGEHLAFDTYFIHVLVFTPLLILVNWVVGLYKIDHYNRPLLTQIVILVKGVFIGSLVFMSGLFFLKMTDFSRGLLLIFCASYVVLLFLQRLAVYLILSIVSRTTSHTKTIVIVGWSETMERFILGLESNRWLGYRVIGYLSANEEIKSSRSTPCLGDVTELGQALQSHLVDYVIIALHPSQTEGIAEVIDLCERVGVPSLIVPDYFDMLPARPRFETFGDMPLIDTRYVPLDDAINAAIKRAFDIIFSSVALFILSPVILFIALGVRLSSPGPVFFAQTRVGKNRKLFTIYKFRTMHANRGSDISSSDVIWTTPNDPRTTKFGQILRRTSLDEIPQFWNVLTGDMSVIGPRPERLVFVEQFKEQIPKYMVKHRVRPGITGWAQVHGWRGDTSIETRIAYDIDYIENWSLALDFRILWKTVTDGMVNPNAY